jgi:hypothetical protein
MLSIQTALSMTYIETCLLNCTVSKIDYMMIRSINELETTQVRLLLCSKR